MVTFDPHPRKNDSGQQGGNRCLTLFGLVALLGCAVYVFSPSSSGIRNSMTLPQGTAKVAGTSGTIDFLSEKCRNTRSQHKEDFQLFIMYWAFPQIKTNGVFLEIGALDGLLYSNSLWFENCLGWTGVLVEGHPVAAEKLRKNRPNATTVEAAACLEDEGTVTFVGKPNGLSGDPNQMPEVFKKNNHKEYADGEGGEKHEVQCRRLGTILREAGVKQIDFWTLDVEGAEWTVLHSFDWDEVAVDVLVIETNKDEKNEYQRRHEFLESKGMEFVGRLNINELWKNPNFPKIGVKT